METFFLSLFNLFLLVIYSLIFIILLVGVVNVIKGEAKLKTRQVIIWLIMFFSFLYLYFYLDGAGVFPDWDKGWSPSRDGWP